MQCSLLRPLSCALLLQAGCLSVIADSSDAGDAKCLDSGEERLIRRPIPGDLEFTEVMASPGTALDDDGEWVELRVIRGSIDLNNVVLARGDRSDGTGTMQGPSDDAVVPDCLEFDTGDHIVLTRWDGQEVLDSAERAMYFDFQLLNRGDNILSLRTDGELIDQIDYDVSPGAAWSRDPETNEWCFSPIPFTDAEIPGMSDFGTPGQPNPPCGQCRDTDDAEWRPIRPPSPTLQHVLITEFMADASSGDKHDEWIEIHNFAAAFDLNGLTLVKPPGSETPTQKRETLTGEWCMVMGPGDYAVLATGPDIGQPTPAYVLDVEMRVVDEDSGFTIFDQEARVLDAIHWDKTSEDGCSTSLDPDFYPKPHEQADDDALAWCYSEQPWDDGGGDKGSPGQANDECPTSPAP
jgi:hypothetical protein